MRKHLDAFTVEQLQEIALKETHGIGHEQDREDAAQDFILGALEAQAKEKKGGAIRSFQWATGRGLVKKFIRANKRRIEKVKAVLDTPTGEEGEDTMASFVAAPVLDPQDATVAHDRAEQVRRAIERLPADWQEIITARFYEGLTLEEIAEQRKISKQGVQQAEARALAKLRTALKHLAA